MLAPDSTNCPISDEEVHPTKPCFMNLCYTKRIYRIMEVVMVVSMYSLPLDPMRTMGNVFDGICMSKLTVCDEFLCTYTKSIIIIHRVLSKVQRERF